MHVKFLSSDCRCLGRLALVAVLVSFVMADATFAERACLLSPEITEADAAENPEH